MRLGLTLPGGQQTLQSVGVGSELGLKRLVLLVFALDVGGVSVALVQRDLQLLLQPVLHLVGVAGELLQRLSLAQLGPVVNQSILQLGPPVGGGSVKS